MQIFKSIASAALVTMCLCAPFAAKAGYFTTANYSYGASSFAQIIYDPAYGIFNGSGALQNPACAGSRYYSVQVRPDAYFARASLSENVRFNTGNCGTSWNYYGDFGMRMQIYRYVSGNWVLVLDRSLNGVLNLGDGNNQQGINASLGTPVPGRYRAAVQVSVAGRDAWRGATVDYDVIWVP
jgi:hypothetical protein